MSLPLEQRPRATCAVCLVQQRAAWWGHIGDSRVYHIRRGQLVQRTRDHSHVELLLREGLITPDQAVNHPMRNFVECCIGGDPILPDMTLSGRRPLDPDDVLFVCTDGMWATLKDEEIAGRLSSGGANMRETLIQLGQLAIARAGGGSDNTSAAALRWLGD
jgi:serine/threonine protein phosphatase PrpC